MKFLSVLIALLSLHFTLINTFELLNSKSYFKFKKLENLLPKNVTISPKIDAHLIEQRLDHFNPQNHQTFDNLYLINEEFHQPDGPIVIFMYMMPAAFVIGGFYYLSEGPVYDFARELNASMVAPSYRFYPFTQPTEDLSLENLRFFTIEQALEDLAHLITDLKSRDGYRNSGVILTGIDYGASLSTWFAQKYPHLVSGIWASNGRVHQSLTPHEPIQMIETVLKTFGSEECVQRVENGFRQLEEMIANNQSRIIERNFRLCFPLPSNGGDKDLAMFFQLLSSFFYTYASVLDAEFYNYEVCDNLLYAPVESDFEAFAYVMGFWDIPQRLCLPINYYRDVEFYKDDTFDMMYDPTMRLDLYAHCTQLGYFFNSGDGSTIFGGKFTSDVLAAACFDVFGFTREQVEANLARFNVMHGGRNPIVRNAYFTVGEFYPWIHQNVDRETIHSSSVYEVIPNRGLMAEMDGIFDDPIFEEVRARVLVAAKRWLGIEEN